LIIEIGPNIMPNLFEEANSREMNRRKRGAPYKYPNTFIIFASIIYTFLRMPYRQLEGFIGKISVYEPGLVAADYTTLHKRISKQDLGIEIPENDAVVAVDSTGIKVTNRGDWIREKHARRATFSSYLPIYYRNVEHMQTKLPSIWQSNRCNKFYP
jgi:hypothetical protein